MRSVAGLLKAVTRLPAGSTLAAEQQILSMLAIPELFAHRVSAARPNPRASAPASVHTAAAAAFSVLTGRSSTIAGDDLTFNFHAICNRDVWI